MIKYFIVAVLALGCSSPDQKSKSEPIKIVSSEAEKANKMDTIYLIAKGYVSKADSIIKLSVNGGMNHKKADKMASKYIDSARMLQATMPESYRNLISEDIKGNLDKALEHIMNKNK